MEPIGRRRWAIAEGYIPGRSMVGADETLISHETACLLNAGDRTAHVTITLYFADRDPAGPYRLEVPPGRTRHVRFNDLEDPEPVPRDTDYASVIESDVPVVLQHTRMDTRAAEIALLSTIAYSEP
ncbi:MAG: sensory rhodopsin transducer [Alphaproteobacteria bacterium]|nr:sensory rhodopsin transducer [Alphaproteobacteria bacterium]